MPYIDTVALDEQNSALVIIDQTQLPNEEIKLTLTEQNDIWKAIQTLQVRGAPAIGIAASIGLYLAAKETNAENYSTFIDEVKAAKEYLASSRPTAVNLFWALDRMEKVALNHRDKSVTEIKDLMRDEAVKIKNEDELVCRSIGEHGLSLIKDGWGILTHCNAGRLAASKYGTALAPVYIGHERGYKLKVFVDETRPLLQGARLTAYELMSAGIDTTLICDNMASQVMKNGWVQAVFTGADRVAANGDACNKIGTSGVAVLAKHYGIPFYICAPTSTVDMRSATGADIPIEERDAAEVTEMWYKERMAPEDVKVYNPAFDCTGNELITAIITEHGIVKPPFNEGLLKMIDNGR